MSYPARGIRVRLAVLFVTGFAILLAAAGAGLYWWLEREYRADFDRELVETAHSAQALFQHDRPEFGSTAETAAHLLTELVFVDRIIVATDQAHRRIASTLPYTGAPLLLDDLDLRLHAPRPVTVSLMSGRARVVEQPLPDGVHLLIAMPLAPLEQRLRQLRLSLLVGLPLILLLGGLVGAFASASALQPIARLAGAADVIAGEVASGATSFSALPSVVADDEIGRLTQAIRKLVDQGSLALRRERDMAEQQRKFLADAAHELRTPVAIIRSSAEASLAGNDAADERRDALAAIAQEATRLGGLVADLLALAREGSTAAVEAREPVFLDDLAHRVVARLRRLPVAAGREITFGDFSEAPVRANPALAERAIFALVHNGLVHAAGSRIELSAGRDGAGGAGASWIRVRDWGPGVPPGAESLVFERFERLDPAVPGSGLGLAIARQIAEVHGGTLTLERPAGGGTAFTLRLPSLDAPIPAS
jgi:signal transduction histidine kinase